MRSTRSRDDGGWTLLELSAVCLILGILVAIAVASYTMSLDRSRRVTCQMDQRIVSNAVLSYAQEHNALPSDLAALDGLIAGREGGYDRCPADHSVVYGYDALTGRVICPLHPSQ